MGRPLHVVDAGSAVCTFGLSCSSPAAGAADAEIKDPSGENPEFEGSPF